MLPRFLSAASLALLLPAFATAQVSPDQQAGMAINAARKAYNEGNLPAAREQFKQVIAKFPNQQGTAAKYGLALTFMNAPEQDFASAVEPLTQAAGDGGFSEKGLVLYHLAVAQRMIGLKEVLKPDGDPKAAMPKFEDALRRFNEAGGWFAGKKDDDWTVRCKCDVAEIQMRMGRLKDARHTLEAITKEPEFAKNKHRPLALYYYGLASFADRDYPAAGRTLNQLAPFTDPAVGLHARYLVGRVLHLSGETAEASVHYDTVLAEFEKQKKDAAGQLKQPDRFKGNPAEKTRLERLADGPPPDHVAGAAFHGATLSYEAGKFADALPKFLGFAAAYPASPLQPDALLRVGFCQVQLKQFDEAAKTLTPMAEKFPKLADQTLYWLGKAQVGIAAVTDPAKADERDAKYKTALDTFRKAAEKAIPPGQQWEAEARGRKGEILMDLGDTLQTLKQFKEAAQAYDTVWKEKLLPERRREEALQRVASATGAAGDIGNSNYLCNEFKKQHPQSTLTPAIAFRLAENAYAEALKVPADPNRTTDRKLKFEEAAHKYQEVVEKYPEFDRVSYARYGVGVCLAQNGDLDGAAKALDAIPAPDRNGELSPANYLLADCLIRLAPTKADDALAENIIREKLTNASGLLENYVASNPKAADAPDALLKLGLCLKRLGSTLADANERNQLLNKAREFYEKVEKDYPQSPQAGHARLEMAKVRAMAGDRGGAMNDLRQFAGGDKQNSPIAPLALVQLATLYREQNQPAEAVKVLEEARKKYEQALANDKDRAEWAWLLKYHHGVALFEAGKLPESRQLFVEVANAAKGKPLGAEAALRAGQTAIALGKKQTDDALQERAKPNLKPNEVSAANHKAQQGREAVYHACGELERHHREFAQAMPGSEPRARMLYDAAWAYRTLMDHELQQARTWATQEANRKWTEAMAKPRPEGVKPPPQPEEIPFAKLQRPRAEERATNAYQLLIQDFPDLALAVDARYELAELLTDREKYDDAIRYLREALDKEPTDRAVSPELLERVRLKLGASLFAKKEYKAAATQFETVAGNEKSPHRAQAIYRHGEALYAQGDFAKAAERLAVFRDKPEFHNVAGVSDRAMLRLGQSLAAAKQWEPARVAFETTVNRYGNSPFVPEARYGLGWALQGQGKYDEAVNQYQAVISATTAEVAARAQTQIGLCRLAQKKYAEATAALMAVPYTYDYPELGYAAVLEAARAYEEDKKPAEAEKLLAKLLKDAPADSDWAKAAKERLEKVKK
ncbi:tetratricopeptide repeat protein [Limnoglobus roseus]|uniref:Outer membrane protein assembly factor BamD n=1 Tax=Limnoglobus roseus TaxID=2598579 RepID=A0A5C1A9T6_9BACT|nr:tetratricopeptide repeat protein [Limnoglobus roseus]QEL13808.1 Outer membrane protein assembly factor BamD [Limnoglobus roseus]